MNTTNFSPMNGYLWDLFIGVKLQENSIKEMEEKLKKVTSRQDPIYQEAIINVDKAKRQLDELKKKKDDVIKSWDKENTNKIVIETDQAERNLKKLQNDLRETDARLDGTKSKFSQFTSIAWWAISLVAIKNFGMSLFNAASNVEQLKISYATMVWSVEKWNKLFADLQQLAKTTPFNMSDVAKSSQLLLAFGYDAQKIIPTMKAMGDAVSAAGWSGETLNNVARALWQIQTKWKLSAQEMNQLAENGIGGWRILAQEMGKTEAQVMKMAEDGKLMSGDVLPKIIAGMEKAFWGNMEKQARTLGGRLSNIQDTLEQLAAKIGATLAPAFNKILDWISFVIDKVDKWATANPRLTAWLVSMAVTLGVLAWMFALLWPIVWWIIAAFNAAAVSGGILAGVMSLLGGPVGIAIWLIAIATGAFIAFSASGQELDLTLKQLEESTENLKKKQEELDEQYRNWKITAEEYRKQTEENKKAMEANIATWDEYKKWLDIINDKHLDYIEKVQQINWLKLNPWAYNALIDKLIQSQIETLKAIRLQRQLLREWEIKAEKDIQESINAYPVVSGWWWLSTNQVTKTQIDWTIKLIDIKDQLIKENDKKDVELKKQEKDLEDTIKKLEDQKKDIGWWPKIGWWWSSGDSWKKSTKESEAVKQAVDRVRSSYTLLDNELKKVASTTTKVQKAQRDWKDSVEDAKRSISKNISDIMKKYDEAVEKINKDFGKKQDETSQDYYRKLLDDQRKLQEEITKEAEDFAKKQRDFKLEYGDISGGFVSSEARNKYDDVSAEIAKQTSELQKKRDQLAEIATQLAEMKNNGLLDASKLQAEDTRGNLTEQGRVRSDFLDKIKQIQQEKEEKIKAEVEIMEEKRKVQQANETIIAAFEKYTRRDIWNLEKQLKQQFQDDESRRLIEKLAKERIDLQKAEDEKKAVESRIFTYSRNLSNEFHAAEMDMIKTRKAEYNELIAKIQEAISAASALRAAQASVGIGWASKSLPGKSDGGYTGDGGKYEPKAVVHGWEYVLSQEMLQMVQSSMPNFIPQMEAIRTANARSIDSSRHINMSAPIYIERPIDLQREFSKILWRF